MTGLRFRSTGVDEFNATIFLGERGRRIEIEHNIYIRPMLGKEIQPLDEVERMGRIWSAYHQFHVGKAVQLLSEWMFWCILAQFLSLYSPPEFAWSNSPQPWHGPSV